MNVYLYVAGPNKMFREEEQIYNIIYKKCIVIIISDLVRCTFTSVTSVTVSVSHRFRQSSEDTCSFQQGKNIS